MVTLVLLMLVILAFSLVFGFIPRSSAVVDDKLRVISLLRTWDFPLQTLTHVEPARLNPLTTLRLGAVGWPLPPNGWFWNRTYNRFRALASRRRNLYMLRFRDRSPLLISLSTPDDLFQIKSHVRS